MTFHEDSVAITIYETSGSQSKYYTLRKDEFQVSTNLGDDETFRVAINDLKAIVDREFDRKNEVDENVYGIYTVGYGCLFYIQIKWIENQ